MRSDRLLALLMLLQTRERVVADDAARELEVSTRTIYRDMDALSAAGVPVFTEQGRHGRLALLPGWRTDMTGLTADEARTLFSVIAGSGADGFGGPLAGALRKLMAGLPAAQRPLAEQARQRILVDASGWRRAGESVPLLGELQSAVFADRRLRLHYRHAGADSDVTRTVDPYGLVVKAGTWYLVAAHRGEHKLFRVSRVRAVSILDEPVRRPDEATLADAWESLGARMNSRAQRCDVTLLVTDGRREMMLRLVAGQLVAAPTRAGTANGWTRLVLSFVSAGAASGMLLSMGADVRVLDPPEVAADIARTAREVVRAYG